MDRINFKSLDKLIAELQVGVDQIKEGKLPVEEFNRILEYARLLNERIAILQYLTEKKSNSSSMPIDDNGYVEKNQINLLDAIDEQEVKIEEERRSNDVSEFDESSKKPSVNELHSNSPQTSLADHFGQQPIKDLTNEIGINERFLLTENLFNGDSKAYSDAIEVLNNFSSSEDALKYFRQELAKKLKWNLKNIQVKRFIKLVERRYQ